MKKKLNPKQIFFILLIQLICIPRGVSQECTGSPVHLTGNGNCLEDLPPLSQGATNNCWAFAYSSMVDAHLRCVEGRQSPSDPGGPPAARTRNREGFRMSPWPIPVTNNSTDVVGEVKRRYNSQCREKMMCQTRPGQFKVLGSVASAPNSGGTFDAAHQIFTKNMNGKTCDHRALGFETANGLHGFMEFLKALYRYDHASHSEANTALAQVFDTLEYESNESAFNNLRNIAAYRRQCSEAIAEFESSYVPFLRSDPRENNSSCTYIRGQGMTTDMQAAVHHIHEQN
ncbi:MAG: hypothetical protein HYV97_07965 [Bdellovibrio sp.]|nr:hypothetical protein [Bdellovibrio sp.]